MRILLLLILSNTFLFSLNAEPVTNVVFDETKHFSILGEAASIQLTITQTSKNSDSKQYNLWNYRVYPTNESYRIFYDEFSRTVSPESFATEEFMNVNSKEVIVELDPRLTVPTQLDRKITTLTHYPETYLSGINYDSLEGYVFSNINPNELLEVTLKRDIEDLLTNQDLCSLFKIEKNEILASYLTNGLWQIGDRLDIESTMSGPITQCDENNVPLIIGYGSSHSVASSTLVNYHPVFSFRGRTFNNVLEFESEEELFVSGNAVRTALSKTYYQFQNGEIASSELSCTGTGLDFCQQEDFLAKGIEVIPPPEPGPDDPEPELDPDKDKGPDCDSEGNPCNPATGNKYQIEKDYRSYDGNLIFERHYNSLSPQDGILGFGWSATGLSKIKIISSEKIKVFTSNGKGEVWRLIGGIWQGDSDTLNTIEHQADGKFHVVSRNNKVMVYGSDGSLLKITDVNGRVTELTYDSNQRLETITGSSGSMLSISYNTDGRIIKVTTPDGDITYSYTGNNLAGVNYSDGSSKTYHYENTGFPNHLTGITDQNGIRYASWAYGVGLKGLVTLSQHHNEAQKVTFSYTNHGEENASTQVTGILGDTRTYNVALLQGTYKIIDITGDECRTCANGFMQSRTYDPNGFLNGYTDWDGNQTTIVNNSRGLPISQTDAVSTPEARTTTTTWHNSLNLPLTITEPKRQTTFIYSTTGQLLTKTVTDPATSESRTTTYTYHPLGSNGGGLIATVDGPRTDVNDITSYAYNASDDLIRITNALGHVTQITSHDASGRPLSIIDANGTDITLSWDLRGRLTQSTFDGRATDYTYDPVGQLTRVTQADDSYLEYSYDDAHRLTGISDNLGNKISYVLDKMGNRTSTTTADSNDVIASSQSAIYDKLSRLQQSLGSNGQQQTYSYDLNHNPETRTDALTRQTQSYYDALDRLIKSIDPDTKETNFEYDTQDNLTKVTDARGLKTTYVYNGFNEVVSQTSSDTGTTTYTYDSAGNVSSMTDARGITVNYTYDALNRVLTETYPDSTELVRYRYDNGNRRNGRIYDMRDSGGRTVFSYDTRGNNTYRRHDVDGYQFITRYYYWNDNRLRIVTYPSGRQVLYTRDAAGRINRVRTRPKVGDPWQYLANNISYEPFGDINGMTLGNGLTYSADFDLDARLIQQTIGTVLDNNYAYDTVNNLITLNDALDVALNQTFTYDTLDRLDTETGQYGTRDLDYDEVGNRTRQQKNWTEEDGTARQSILNGYYSSTANQLDTFNSQTPYVYDAVGNTLTDRNGRRTLTYNDAGRLETVAYDGIHRATYSYNAQGQRVKKARTLTDGRILNYYFQYDKQGQLLSEVYYIDTRLVSYTDFVWLLGRPIAQIKTLYKSNGDLNRVETRYLHTDHLNTPRKATDENGKIVWRWDSDGFGHVQPDRDPDGDGKKQYVRLRFAGQYHDVETGLFYNYFRYYDPYTGRYITSDPIGLLGGMNTYRYVDNNPISSVDLMGLKKNNHTLNYDSILPPVISDSDMMSMENSAKNVGMLPFKGIAEKAISKIPNPNPDAFDYADKFLEINDIAGQMCQGNIEGGLNSTYEAIFNPLKSAMAPYVNAFSNWESILGSFNEKSSNNESSNSIKQVNQELQSLCPECATY